MLAYFDMENQVLRARSETAGVVEYWSGGVLEYWSTGVMEYWSTGVMEYWSDGVLSRRPVFTFTTFHYSITPTESIL